jgi:hypothetical protein
MKIFELVLLIAGFTLESVAFSTSAGFVASRNNNSPIFAATGTTDSSPQSLDEKQIDFVMG